MAVLSGEQIRKLIQGEPPLVEAWIDLEEQVQTNGFDLSLRDVARMDSPGIIAASNAQRVLPKLTPLFFNADGFIDLAPGAYTITYNEIVNMPRDIMALATPRSSLLRCGVSVHTAIWDAGYTGRSQSLMVVYHPRGFRLQRNARVVQIFFLALSKETEGYRGVYQRENIIE